MHRDAGTKDEETNANLCRSGYIGLLVQIFLSETLANEFSSSDGETAVWAETVRMVIAKVGL